MSKDNAAIYKELEERIEELGKISPRNGKAVLICTFTMEDVDDDKSVGVITNLIGTPDRMVVNWVLIAAAFMKQYGFSLEELIKMLRNSMPVVDELYAHANISIEAKKKPLDSCKS